MEYTDGSLTTVEKETRKETQKISIELVERALQKWYILQFK